MQNEWQKYKEPLTPVERKKALGKGVFSRVITAVLFSVITSVLAIFLFASIFNNITPFMDSFVEAGYHLVGELMPIALLNTLTSYLKFTAIGILVFFSLTIFLNLVFMIIAILRRKSAGGRAYLKAAFVFSVFDIIFNIILFSIGITLMFLPMFVPSLLPGDLSLLVQIPIWFYIGFAIFLGWVIFRILANALYFSACAKQKAHQRSGDTY